QPLMENLLDKGAKDVFMTPIVMKKSRPATKVSVLVAPDQVEVVAEVLFTSSTTIGLRTSQVSKLMLPREAREIPTRYGVVTIKLVTLPNGSVRWKSEHEDVLRLANEHGIEYLEMKAALDAEIKTRLAAS
ncbi:MAG: DUF111 family protein, partial [Gammaproteobacteria bacterium]|nr:DUF111 family protein [Gammaproteobacteria bacterium]